LASSILEKKGKKEGFESGGIVSKSMHLFTHTPTISRTFVDKTTHESHAAFLYKLRRRYVGDPRNFVTLASKGARENEGLRVRVSEWNGRCA
jgi:hypothetical protein